MNHTILRNPRRRATVVFIGVFALAGIVNACKSSPVAVAAEPESSVEEQQEIQTVYFPMIEKEAPVYNVPVMDSPVYVEAKEHRLNEDDVKLLARLLWSSPLRDERQKKALAWVVCNRIGVTPYGDTIAAVINKTEFTFLDRKAHISEENKRIATEVLNAYYSIREGMNVQRGIPANGVKVQFVGDPARYIRVLDKNYNVVWDGTER